MGRGGDEKREEERGGEKSGGGGEVGKGVVEVMSGTRAGGEVEGFMAIPEDHEANDMFVEFPFGSQMDCTTKAVCVETC